MYLLIDFCCTLLAHMPLYIAPSFLKLFLLLYSGRSQGEGETQEGKFNQTMSTSSGAVPWPVEGPVLKPQHLECKMQFHSAAAPAAQRGFLSREVLGAPRAAFLRQEQEQELCWALDKPLGCCWQRWCCCFVESRDAALALLSPWGPSGLLGRGGVHGEGWHWKAALHQAPSAVPWGNTKLLTVSTIIAKISLLVSWCRGQEQTHSWEL